MVRLAVVLIPSVGRLCTPCGEARHQRGSGIGVEMERDPEGVCADCGGTLSECCTPTARIIIGPR